MLRSTTITRQVARKDHWCCACTSTIAPGDRYVRYRLFDDENDCASTMKLHCICYDLVVGMSVESWVLGHNVTRALACLAGKAQIVEMCSHPDRMNEIVLAWLAAGPEHEIEDILTRY